MKECEIQILGRVSR